MENYDNANKQLNLHLLKDLMMNLSNNAILTDDEFLLKTMDLSRSSLNEYYSDLIDEEQRNLLIFGVELLEASPNNLALHCILVSLAFYVTYEGKKETERIMKDVREHLLAWVNKVDNTITEANLLTSHDREPLN